MMKRMKLSNKQLQMISGGISVLGAMGIVAGAVFVVGTLDGWARPAICRN